MSSSAGYQQLPQSVHEDDVTESQTSTSHVGQGDKKRSVRPDRIDLKKLDSAFKRWASQLLVPSSLMFMRAGQMDRIDCAENEKEEEGLRTHQKADMAQRLRAYFRAAFCTRGFGEYPKSMTEFMLVTAI